RLLSEPFQKATEHRSSVSSLRMSIAWDEKRVAAMEDRNARAAAEGRVIHGADAVVQSFRSTIAHNTKLLHHHEELQKEYERAASKLWVPAVREPTEPR